jgi:methylated-DNA-[protein]-cysteine S-methyltransferase
MDRWWRQESPVGILTVHTTEQGVHRIEFGDHPLDAPEERDRAIATELDQYFAARRRVFTVPLDLSDVEPGFPRTVYETLRRDVVWGETVTYGELGEMAGRPRAGRAVGNLMARTPVPIVIPCHRVIAAGGRIGGWGPSGTETKRYLLGLEGVSLP